MVVNTHYRNNLEAVMQVGKNYTDTEIKKSEERILSIVARNNVDFIDHTDEATYRFTAPLNSKLLMLQSIAGNSVKYAPTTASDTTSAYQKTIPSYSPSIDRASASMNILGGMSYKVNQIIPPKPTYSSHEITMNFNSTNGNYVFNGTADANAMIFLQTVSDTTIYLTTGHKYLLTSNYSGLTGTNLADTWNSHYSYSRDGSNKFIFTGKSDRQFQLSLTVQSGVELNNYSFYANLFDLTADFGSGNEPTSVSDCATEYAKRGIDIYSYTPQQSAIRDTAITNVKSVGVNVMGLENVAETTRNGVTYSVNNGVISLNGTVTSGFELKLYFDEITSGTYSSLLSINKTGSVFTDSLWLIANGTSYNLGRANGATNTLNISDKSNYIRTWLYGNESFTNVQIKITLIKGSTAPTTYIPYFSDTLAINSNIQALDGYGWGINDTYYNYIDFNAKKFIKKVNRVKLKDCTIVYDSETQRFIITIPNIEEGQGRTLPLIILGYDIKTNGEAFDINWNMVAYNGLNQSAILLHNHTYTLVSDLKANEGEKYIYYPLATPVEIDISQYLDGNEIEIEPNGTLSFESTYSAYVPSNVSYNGVIKHALATAVKYESFNKFDKTTAIDGEWITNTGATLSGSGNSHSDYISILPSTTYYFKNVIGSNNFYSAIWYDENKNFISYSVIGGGTSVSGTLTSPNNAYYVIANFKTDYKDSICINISNQDLNGTYKPHKPTYTRALTNNEAKYSWGITTGVRNVRTYCDDEGNAVNEGSLAVGNQDLGDIGYTYNSTYDCYYGNLDVKNQGSAISEKYLCTIKPANNLDVNEATTYWYWYANVRRIFVKTGIESLQPSGNIFYEKATTDTETLDDFDYFFDCEEGDTFTLVNVEQLQCYATYSFLIKEAKSNE